MPDIFQNAFVFLTSHVQTSGTQSGEHVALPFSQGGGTDAHVDTPDSGGVWGPGEGPLSLGSLPREGAASADS